MHAPNSTAIVTATDPCTPTHQNAPLCTTNSPNALPSLTPHPLRLTPRQHAAISLMCCGMNLEVVAARLKINRSTLYRWRTTHPAFVAELARRQRELRDTAARRLRKHLLEALETVADHVQNARHQEDRVKTALTLLRLTDLPALLSAGLDDPATPTLALDHLIRQDWTSRNLHPDRQVDPYDRGQYLKHLAEADALDPDTRSTPTHRRLAGTKLSSPENYPTAENTPADPQIIEFPENSANSPARE